MLECQTVESIIVDSYILHPDLSLVVICDFKVDSVM